MGSRPTRREVLRYGAAGTAAWFGLPLAQLLARVPAAAGAPFSPGIQGAPGDPDDVAYLTIAEASALLRSGDLTPTDLVQACFRRIRLHEPRVQAFVARYEAEALREAERAGREIASDGQRTPLHGIPIAHKDLYDIEGEPTRAGSKVRDDAPPAARDATVVARLRRAGAIVLGKTNTHEFAYGVWTPPTSNPWDLARIPGGSSGGSGAAMASGFALGATGTDTGGSIRIPSSLCNAVGLKPTYGRTSRAGVIPLAWTLDHTGPICRSVEDAAIMLDAVAGPDAADPTTAPVPVPRYFDHIRADVVGRRLGVPTSVFFDGADPETASLVRAAARTFAQLGVDVLEIDAPPTQYIAATAYTVVQLVEPLAAHEHYLRTRPHDYQQQTQVLFGLGEPWHSQHYVRAQRIRTINIAEWLRVFEDVDAVLTPATPRPAPTKEEAQATGVFDLINYTSPFDFNGCPSISVPAGLGAAGLPVGAMLSARPFDELRLLQLAFAYQQATGHNRARPPLRP